MFDVISVLLGALATTLKTRQQLFFENFALRHQIQVLNRKTKRPNLRATDRLLWVVLSRLCESTLRKYRPKTRRSNQTWKTFLRNHTKDLVAVDFFTVPTATFRVLFVVVIIAHERRRVLHFNITDSPSAAWTGHQLVEAFPWGEPPRHLPRDRDRVYGADFVHRVEGMGLEQKPTLLVRVPFIFLTAKGEKDDLRSGMNLGADDYLTKPVANADLIQAIEARLRRAGQQVKREVKPDFSSSAPLVTFGLTPRAAEALLWLAQGKTQAQVMHRTCICSICWAGQLPMSSNAIHLQRHSRAGA